MDQQETKKPEETTPVMTDENMHLMVYGNLKIRDIDTGELIVNKRI